MSANTKIEWTDASWTPIRARHKTTGKVGWHCEHVTPGCENCYAEGMNKRLGTGFPFKPGHRKDIELFLDETMLLQPLKWKKPRMIFVCSMTDLFADFVPDEWIDKVFAVMALCPQHTFQVLTKRSKRMREYLSNPNLEDWLTELWQQYDPDKQTWNLLLPLRNVWLGISAEDQTRADERIPDLLATPAAVHFISAEPLLGPLNLDKYLHDSDCDYVSEDYGPGYLCTCEEPHEQRVNWVILGGESGTGARPMHPDWARDIRDQCKAAGTAFFFKQWGEYLPEIDRRHQDTGIEKTNVSNTYWPDGTIGPGKSSDHGGLGAGFSKLGKARAGRLLDGVEHKAMPEVKP